MKIKFKDFLNEMDNAQMEPGDAEAISKHIESFNSGILDEKGLATAICISIGYEPSEKIIKNILNFLDIQNNYLIDNPNRWIHLYNITEN